VNGGLAVRGYGGGWLGWMSRGWCTAGPMTAEFLALIIEAGTIADGNI